MLDNFRFLHVRAEINRLPIVVLEKCQDIMQSDSGNENGTLPIVNHAARNLDVRAGGSNPSHDNLSALQFGSGVSGGWLQVINPQEIVSAETLAAARVSFAFGSVKGVNRPATRGNATQRARVSFRAERTRENRDRANAQNLRWDGQRKTPGSEYLAAAKNQLWQQA